jgi:O-antigen/teichoic acid export membrane protein
MNLRSKVIESIRWLAIAQLISQSIRIGVSIYVISQLESEHMAYVALSGTITNFLEMFSTLGLGAVVITRKEITEKDLSNIAGMLVLINLILGILLVGLSGTIADFYNTPALADILRVMSLGFLFVAVSSVPTALMTKDMRFKELSVIQLCAGILGALASFILVNLGFEYWSIVMGGLAFIVVRSLLVIIANGGIVRPRFAVRESMEFVNFGGFVMLGGIFWYIYAYVDVAIGGRFWSPQTLGFYAVAVQLTVMPLNRMMPIFKQVALPAYSRSLKEDKSQLQNYIGKSLHLSMSFCAPLFFGISSTAILLVPLLLGPNWSGASLPLALLCISAPFRVLLELMSPAMIASGQPRPLMNNTLVITIIMIMSFFVAANLSSDPAAFSLVWVLVFPLLAVFSSRSFCKTMGVDFRCVSGSIVTPIVNSALMWIGVSLFIKLATPYFPLWLVLVEAIAIGILLYCVLVYLFDRNLFAEIKSLRK